MISGKFVLRLAVMLSSLFFLFQQDVQASHIVGGDLTYRCLGNNMYEIRLTVRRDCFLGDPDAQFDDPASIGFYDGVSGQFLSFLGTMGLLINYNEDDTLNEILVSDCSVVAGDVCVHTTTYVSTIFLPFRASGYTMAYQRCCRNMSINNIVDPDDTGMTLVAELSALAQSECNSSPQFGEYPPIYTCVNKPIMFDHSADDPEADSLVYELCVPYSGATRNSPRPQPPSLPLNEPVVYRPPYSLSNLMGGVPLQIDPNTGILTGTPNTVGQFVIGICVKAYKNGQLTGTTRRDFQYNVRMCRDVPVAQFNAPPLDCDDLSVTFDNQSLLADNYTWIFGYPGGPTSTEFEPTFTFPAEGFYNVALIASDSLGFCYDTLIRQIGVFNSQIVADFDWDVSRCDEDAIVLNATDLSSGFHPDYPACTFEWLLTVDGNVYPSSQQNPTFEVDIDGSASALLCFVVTSCNGCTATACRSFQLNEIVIDFNPLSDSMCFGDTVQLLVGANPDFTYTFSPDIVFGNFEISPVSSTDINVTVTDGLCEVTATTHVEVQQLPNLAFDFDPDCRTLQVVFDNNTTGGVLYEWDFGTPPPGNTSTDENPTFTFPGPGQYTVTLSSRDGCDVSISQVVTANNITEDIDDQTVNCFEPSVALNPDFDPSLNYVWAPAGTLDNPNSGNPLASPLDDTEYCVTITTPGLEDCPVIECIDVLVPDAFTVNAGSDITSCKLEEITLTATSNGNVTYEWFLNGQSVGTGPTYTLIPSVTEVYTVVATDTLGCTREDQVTVNVPPPTFIVTTNDDTTYCNVQTISLNASSINGVTFEWYNCVGDLIGNGEIIEVTPGDPTCFVVIGTDPLGCQESDTVTLTPTFFDLDISDGHSICLGETIDLSITDNNNQDLSYLWYPIESIKNGAVTATPTVMPMETTEYCSMVTNNTIGCIDTICTTVEVNLFNPVVVSITADRDSVTLTEQVVLTVNQAGPPTNSFVWSASNGENLTGINSHIITVTPSSPSTTYTVTVTNEAGCTAVASYSIGVHDPACDDSDIFIPNAFTPNGDGINDMLFVRGNFISTMELHIYNRWGQEVFMTNNQAIGWDGKFEGKLLHPDVFGYYMEIGCPNQKTFFKKGNITILQ